MPLLQKIRSSAKLLYAQWLNTKSRIGAALVVKLAGIFNCLILIVCDSWFGSLTLLKKVRKHLQQKVDLLSRLRVSVILFDFPENMPPKRGRK